METGYYYSNNNYYSSYWDYLFSNITCIPLHLYFFMIILISVLGFSWYINYESVLEDLMNQIKFFLILSPLLLLLLLHCLSGTRRFSFLDLFPERDSVHRAGGSPWGVALLLVFLLFMISYQSSLHERWFPLIAK
ncbi:hypothetical protein LINPERPRIM_LOCUS8387 [Linum perenne]